MISVLKDTKVVDGVETRVVEGRRTGKGKLAEGRRPGGTCWKSRPDSPNNCLRNAALVRPRGADHNPLPGTRMKPIRRDSSVQWLRSVMDQYEGPLLRYADRILGDVERAREVVQDTFLRLLKSDRGRNEDHLAEWLFTVCRNRALDVCRKERRMGQLSEYSQRSQPSAEPSPPAVVEQREQVGRVAEALRRLPHNQQEVLRLKFQNGFSYKQIAGITGLSVSNVGFLIHTGIQRLRRQFKAAGLIGRG